MSPDLRHQKIVFWLTAGVVGVVAVSVLFMTLGAKGSWSFVLPFRGAKLAGLVIVAVSIAVSTVVFQTIANNRILTPSIMGFDALYVLIQTTLVYFLGGLETSGVDPRIMFALEIGLMLTFALLLFKWMFGPSARSLHLLLLVGIVLGAFFRSLSSLMQRLIDPSEFLLLQDRLFASFNGVDQTLLGVSTIILVATIAVLWRLTPALDVMTLGRDHARALGVAHDRVVALSLGLITILICVSTALVGPVTFFGLLVANLAYALMPTARHAILLPASALIACILLIGGQVILERVFAFDTALAVIIEFIGGIVFILLVVRKGRR